MDNNLFEFLAVYFPQIHTEKQKKKFLNWLNNYLLQDDAISFGKNIYLKNGATRLLLINFETPERFFWGRRTQSPEERKKYLILGTLIKIVFIFISIILLLVGVNFFAKNNYLESITFFSGAVFTYVLGLGIPRKYNFSHIATLTTAIQIFEKSNKYNLKLINTEFLSVDQIHDKKVDTSVYEETIFLKNIYESSDIFKKEEILKNKRITTYFSGKFDEFENDVKLLNNNVVDNSTPPRKIYNSIEEIEKIVIPKI